MKVILLQDIGGVGRRFEVKDVPNGHALNFLIPKKMVEPATPKSIKRLEERAQQTAADMEGTKEDFAKALSLLKEKTIEVSVSANEKGSLFEGLKNADIHAALVAGGITVSEESISTDAPIKELGEHEVMLQHGDLKGTFTLTVKAK